jgi:hypothetical protein
MSVDESTLFDQSDRERLDLTQSVREQIIRSLTAKGLPENKEDRAFLLEAMNGSDRTVLSKAKIKAEDAASKKASDLTNIVGEILARVSTKRDGIVFDAGYQAPKLDNTFTVENPVEGETVIGVETLTYEKFMGQEANS